MRPLLAAALGLVAGVAHTAPATPKPQTLYVRPHGEITAFAQDGPLVAWFAKGKPCNTVHVLSLANGLQVPLPTQGTARNVTCKWDVGSTVGLALGGTNVLWTLRENDPIPFDYVVGADARPVAVDREERRFQEVAHTKRGSGLWLGGIAGDHSTLVYGTTSVDYEDEAGCLAGTGSCALKVAGGGVYRIVGRKPEHVAGTGPAVAVAASGGSVAYVPPSSSVGKDGRPAADLEIDVVDARTGTPVSSVTTQGPPMALAFAPHALATLERTALGLRLAWYDPATGAPGGSVSVPQATSPELTASDQLVVFHVGRSLRAVDLVTHAIRVLGRASVPPIGLSLEGGRLAWAENINGTGRIRALYVRGRG
jgi:hypothetical protein